MLQKKIFDIIICVHNSPKFLRWCLHSVFQNSDEILFNVIIVDDFSDEVTKSLIQEFEKAHPNILVITNKTNLGYVKSANEGIRNSVSENIVMLNSDAIVTKGWLEKFQTALQNDPKIGLISPLSNNAANLSIRMHPGFSFVEMNECIEKNSKKIYPDAMTVVGHCLVITRKVIDKIGLFDEVYSPAYTEETDYHFKAINNGFRAIIADDTFVYHKGEASFENRSKLFEEHLKIFLSRYGTQFKKLHADYEKRNELGYLRNQKTLLLNFEKISYKPEYDVVFLLPSLAPGIGGIITVIEIVNRLILSGIRANIAYFGKKLIDDGFLFEPIQYEDSEELIQYPPRTKIIVATEYGTAEPVAKIAELYKMISAYFIQDYEGWFNSSRLLNKVKETYRLIDNKIVVSHWLQGLLKEQDNYESAVINVGVSHEELYKQEKIPPEIAELKKNCKIIVMSLLNMPNRRGSVYFIQAAREILDETDDIGFVVTHRNSTEELIDFENPRFINLNMVPWKKMPEYLSSCDIIVDSSIYHGFGLPGLEGMSCGMAAILTDVDLDYSEDGVNCILTKPKDIVQIKNAIKKLRDDPELLSKMKRNARQTAKRFSWEKLIENYVTYFNKLLAMYKTDVDRPLLGYEKLLANKNIKKTIFPASFIPPPPKLSKKNFRISTALSSFNYYKKHYGVFFAFRESLKWIVRS